MESNSRSNIFLSVKPRLPTTGGANTAQDSYEEAVHPIFSRIANEKEKAPKTLIYLPLKWCGTVHEYANLYAISEDLVKPEVVQFHAPQTVEVCKHLKD